MVFFKALFFWHFQAPFIAFCQSNYINLICTFAVFETNCILETTGRGLPEVRAFELLTGLATTQVLVALTRLNVFKIIGQGKKTVDELAMSCRINKNLLARVLRYAQYFDLVVRTGNEYLLSETGKYFLNGRPESLIYSMGFVAAPPWRDSWNNFSYSLKTGEPAFDSVHQQSFFDFLDTHPEYGKPFNEIMTRLTEIAAPKIADAYDFGVFKTICDIGGGQGMVLKSILKKYPACSGILFDNETALQYHVLGNTLDRAQLVAGNFFDTIPSADGMVLKTVVHNWNDPDSIKILTNCRKALNPGGKLLLIEMLVEEPYEITTLFYDLYMQTLLGGAERTKEEFQVLLEAAGLQLERVLPTGSALRIIEASVKK